MGGSDGCGAGSVVDSDGIQQKQGKSDNYRQGGCDADKSTGNRTAGRRVAVGGLLLFRNVWRNRRSDFRGFNPAQTRGGNPSRRYCPE